MVAALFEAQKSLIYLYKERLVLVAHSLPVLLNTCPILSLSLSQHYTYEKRKVTMYLHNHDVNSETS